MVQICLVSTAAIPLEAGACHRRRTPLHMVAGEGAEEEAVEVKVLEKG